MSETESTDTRSRTFLDKFENNFAPDVNYAKFLNDPFSTTSIPSEYKISYAPTMESQIRRLRLSMETYREILVLTNGVLLWEKQWHPTAIIGGVTALFMLIWLSEPNILTIISLIGLIITVTDYILPAVVTAIFRTESWTNEKQRKYEEICTNIILYKTKFELLATSYYRMRITNPKLDVQNETNFIQSMVDFMRVEVVMSMVITTKQIALKKWELHVKRYQHRRRSSDGGAAYFAGDLDYLSKELQELRLNVPGVLFVYNLKPAENNIYY